MVLTLNSKWNNLRVISTLPQTAPRRPSTPTWQARGHWTRDVVSFAVPPTHLRP